MERPGEGLTNVNAVVALAGRFGLVAKDPLVNADVPDAAQLAFNDVVEFHTGRWPLGQCRRN